MQRRIVLVDFDGVVLKNKTAGNYIKTKVERFVQKVTPIKDPKLAEIYNKELYTSHGHTLIGLRKHGCDVSLTEFNEYVYGDTRCYSDLIMEDNELKEWRLFCDNIKNCNYEIKLFSNSGTEWMSHFLKNDVDTDLLEFQNYLDKYRYQPIYNSLLKPKREIYDLFMSYYTKSSYYFIDDKISNFEYIQYDPRWIKIWFTCSDGWGRSGSGRGILQLSEKYYAVSSLYDVSLLLSKNVKI